MGNENIDAELAASLIDAIRWMDALFARYCIINEMPNNCRGRVQMCAALAAWEQEHAGETHQ